MNYWLVGLGGLVGSLLRYGVSELTLAFNGDHAAMSAYVCNILGSFLLSWLLVRVAARGRWNERIRIAVGTGLIGSFTTFSALSVEVLDMLNRGAFMIAAIYVLLSILGGWIAAWLGWRLGHRAKAALESRVSNQ